MRPALALLQVVLVALLAAPASAAPDGVTGGVTVPDGRLTGGGATGGEPLEPPAAAVAEALQVSPEGGVRARAAQAETEPQPDAAPPAADDDEDVDVQVPVREGAGEQPPAPVATGSSGGLPQTGFGAAALAALGAGIAAGGLMLRRLAR